MTQLGHILFKILRKNHVASTTKLSFFRYTSKNNTNKYFPKFASNLYHVACLGEAVTHLSSHTGWSHDLHDVIHYQEARWPSEWLTKQTQHLIG